MASISSLSVLSGLVRLASKEFEPSRIYPVFRKPIVQMIVVQRESTE